MRVRIGIYARVSKAEKDDPSSIPIQLADCQRRAESEGWTVVDDYVDTGVSAWNPRRKRPEFERLLTDIETGRVDGVLVREQERLLRQMRDAVRIQDLSEAGKLRLIAATMESDINFRRARDRDDFRKRASQAQFYSDFLSEKIKDTKAQRRETGAYTGGEREPMGYRRLNGGLEVDAKEQALLRDAVRRLGQGRTATSIVRQWNAEDVTTSKGARWRTQTLRRTLLSDHLTGGRGYPRVLSDEEAAVARAALASEERPPGRPRGLRAPLSGFVFCSECGARMTTGSGYYRCSASHGGCGGTSILAWPLDQYIIQEVARRWRPRFQKRERSPERNALLADLQQLEQRARDIADGLASGTLSVQVAGQASRQVEQRRREVTEALARGMPTPETPQPKNQQEMLKMIKDAGEQASAFVRGLLTQTVERITISRRQRRGRGFEPDRVEITWKPARPS
jgi:site-specific DNA recombinase